MTDQAHSDECRTQHGQILSRLDHLAADVEYHLAETHGQVNDDASEVHDALFGPRRSELQGGGRRSELGMVERTIRTEKAVALLTSQAANGGVPAKLSKKDKRWLATVAAVVIALAETIQAFV